MGIVVERSDIRFGFICGKNNIKISIVPIPTYILTL